MAASDTVKQPDMEVDEQGYLGSPVEEKHPLPNAA